METEWADHVLNTKIDHALETIADEIDFTNKTTEQNIKTHYHKNPRTVCTPEMEERSGGCCGTSPYVLLKKTLETRLAELNKKYPTSPLPEIE